MVKWASTSDQPQGDVCNVECKLPCRGLALQTLSLIHAICIFLYIRKGHLNIGGKRSSFYLPSSFVLSIGPLILRSLPHRKEEA